MKVPTCPKYLRKAEKKLAKSISDAGWSRFITYLDYKLKLEGKYLVNVDRWFASSKLCSGCNEKNIMLTLNDRVWVCNSCDTEDYRDVNASWQLLEQVSDLDSTGIQAVCDELGKSLGAYT